MSISGISNAPHVPVQSQPQAPAPQATPVDSDGDEISEDALQTELEARAKAAAARGGIDIKV